MCKQESPADTSSPVLERLRRARAELAEAELEFGRNIPLCACMASDGHGDIELGLLDEDGHRRYCRLNPVGAAILADTLARFVAEPEDPPSDEPLLAGMSSPALERYRVARAELAELELEAKRRQATGPGPSLAEFCASLRAAYRAVWNPGPDPPASQLEVPPPPLSQWTKGVSDAPSHLTPEQQREYDEVVEQNARAVEDLLTRKSEHSNLPESDPP